MASSHIRGGGEVQQESPLAGRSLLHGGDFNGRGQVEPFEGECGLEQIGTLGVLVNGMNLVGRWFAGISSSGNLGTASGVIVPRSHLRSSGAACCTLRILPFQMASENQTFLLELPEV